MKAIDKQTIQGLGRNETPYYGDSDISDLNKGDKEGMFTNPTSTLDIDPLPSKETVIPDMNGGSLIPNPINASDTFLINFEDIMMPGTKKDMSAPIKLAPRTPYPILFLLKCQGSRSNTTSPGSIAATRGLSGILCL